MYQIYVMYLYNIPNYEILTYKPLPAYVTSNIVKYAEKKSPKIVFAYCDNINDFGKQEWDIYVLLFSKHKNIREQIKKIFSDKVPLYAVCCRDYIIITKLISIQIFQLSEKGCTVPGIMDLYLYEMGAVLCDKTSPKPLREFKGNRGAGKILWKLNKDLLKSVNYIKPRLHGWFSKDTELLLHFAIKNYKAATIVELGSWYGKSTGYILDTMPNDAKLYCFDKFQNITQTDYDFSIRSPLDKFYFETPRYETFIRNISEHLKGNKVCITVKEDVNNFLTIMAQEFVKPDIIFIDAIKRTDRLLQLYDKIFTYNPLAVIVGDDYVFNSVKKAVKIYKNRASIYVRPDAYLMTKLQVNKNNLNNLFNKMYLPALGDKDYYYELAYNAIFKSGQPPDISKLDVNQPLARHNNNTLYTLAIIASSTNITNKFIDLILSSKGNLVKNVLGLTWQDYKKDKNLIW